MEHFENASNIYVVMKWASNNLSTFMRRNKLPFLTEQELKVPLWKILKAVRAIHKVGYLHNNITPSNIFFVVLNEKQHKVRL